MAEITELTDATFGDVVFKSPEPVLVQFWAPWSKACLLADPPLEAAVRTFSGEIRLLRLNVEENPMAATVYGVRSIPLLILFRQGEEFAQWAGPIPKDEVIARLRAAREQWHKPSPPDRGTGQDTLPA